MKSRKPRWYIVSHEKSELFHADGFPTKVDEQGRYWVLAQAKDLMRVNRQIVEYNISNNE